MNILDAPQDVLNLLVKALVGDQESYNNWRICCAKAYMMTPNYVQWCAHTHVIAGVLGCAPCSNPRRAYHIVFGTQSRLIRKSQFLERILRAPNTAPLRYEVCACPIVEPPICPPHTTIRAAYEHNIAYRAALLGGPHITVEKRGPPDYVGSITVIVHADPEYHIRLWHTKADGWRHELDGEELCHFVELWQRHAEWLPLFDYIPAL